MCTLRKILTFDERTEPSLSLDLRMMFFNLADSHWLVPLKKRKKNADKNIRRKYLF
jgi:hypothetical protein